MKKCFLKESLDKLLQEFQEKMLKKFLKGCSDTASELLLCVEIEVFTT